MNLHYHLLIRLNGTHLDYMLQFFLFYSTITYIKDIKASVQNCMYIITYWYTGIRYLIIFGHKIIMELTLTRVLSLALFCLGPSYTPSGVWSPHKCTSRLYTCVGAQTDWRR